MNTTWKLKPNVWKVKWPRMDINLTCGHLQWADESVSAAHGALSVGRALMGRVGEFVVLWYLHWNGSSMMPKLSKPDPGSTQREKTNIYCWHYVNIHEDDWSQSFVTDSKWKFSTDIYVRDVRKHGLQHRFHNLTSTGTNHTPLNPCISSPTTHNPPPLRYSVMVVWDGTEVVSHSLPCMSLKENLNWGSTKWLIDKIQYLIQV